VPLGRYFLFIGGVLLAILFIAERYLPQSASENFTREARADKSFIRITSGHQWPERVVFDTSLPAIVPPALPVLAEAPVVNQPGPAQAPVISQPREAFALLIAPVQHGSESPKQARTKRKAVKPIPATRMADYRPAVRSEALPAGW
jgi:hypothetical protein